MTLALSLGSGNPYITHAGFRAGYGDKRAV